LAGTIQKVRKIEENAKCRKGKLGIYFNFMGQIPLEKLVILQLIEIFFTLYGTQRFITAFTGHFPHICSYPEPHQSSPCPPILPIEYPS
jgi:hypothetical protein